MPRDTTKRRRSPLNSWSARYPAEATEDGPSYSAAFETGRPVSSLIAVWYSNIAWRLPWLTSGWYGVYGVMNSERPIRGSVSAGWEWAYMPAAGDGTPSAAGRVPAGRGGGGVR